MMGIILAASVSTFAWSSHVPYTQTLLQRVGAEAIKAPAAFCAGVRLAERRSYQTQLNDHAAYLRTMGRPSQTAEQIANDVARADKVAILVPASDQAILCEPDGRATIQPRPW